MPIRRPRGPKPALRHLAFLSGMADTPEGSAPHRESRAGFLVLRQLDHWVAYGGGGGSPTERSTEVTAEAVRAVTEDDELRAAYLAIVTAIPTISDVDAQPLLPRVFALGSLFEQRGRTAQAADVYTTVVRYVDPVAHLDLAYDASMRQAACLRQEGELDHADQAYTHAGTLAARVRDRPRILSSRVGRAKITWLRGNLPRTEEALLGLEEEAREAGATALVAIILHELAALHHHRGDTERAIRVIWDAYRLSPDEYDKERMLEDLALFLARHGAFESARDALQVIERASRRQEARWLAQVNLMDLAFRSGDELQFHHYRRALESAPLPVSRRVAYLKDAGVGQTRFGEYDAARLVLQEALRLAELHHLNQRLFQIEQAIQDLDKAERTRSQAPTPVLNSVDAPIEIREALRSLRRQVETQGA